MDGGDRDSETPALRRILVLYAHPAQRQSQVNRWLFEAANGLSGVTAADLYAEYPRYEIDIDREQERLRRHDVIIFQHPFYWYSTPALLKEWQDLVLEHGFAYGAGGDALKGKIFFNAITAGAPEDAYRAKGFNRRTLGELLYPLEQTAHLCGMTWLPPFALYRSRHAAAEGLADTHRADWLRLLRALRDGTLDITAAQSRPRLDDGLADLIREG